MAVNPDAPKIRIGSSPVVPAHARWWKTEDADKAAQIAHATLTNWSSAQRWRHASYNRLSRLYAPPPPGTMSPANLGRLAALRSSMGERVTYNVVQSCVDTLTSKIARNKPKALFLTNGGDHKAQRKAKMLNRFTDGVFYECGTHALGRQAFRDALIWGDGIIHVFERDGRVAHERVPASEIYVDEAEADLAEPRTMHRVKLVDRAVLAEAFPEKAETVEKAKRTDFADVLPVSTDAPDLVTVVESWRLPSGPDADDGYHLISVSSGSLTDLEPWTHDCFPFARFSFSPRPRGYWAQGLCEQLQGIQIEINRLLFFIQKSLEKGGYKLWIKTGNAVAIEHLLANELGSVIRSDDKPEVLLPQTVHPEVLNQVGVLIQRAYEVAGISQLSATSQKPAGLDSGRAIREYNDINTERFMTVGQAYEEFFLDLARLSVLTVQDIVERTGSRTYKVKSPRRKSLDVIDWSQIALTDDDDYVMQCFPVSSLPSDPAGRLQTIQEYMQAGILDADEGRELLDFPDLDRIESLHQAQKDWLASVLDRMVDEGEAYSLEPYDNVGLAHKMALEYYQRGKVQGLPEDRLQLLRDFLSEIEQEQKKTAAMASALPAGAPTDPMALPEAPPTSELLPTMPQVA